MAEPNKPTRTLINIAGIVAAATLISKFFGLFRQQAIAAAFGVGPAFGAFNFAYVIPGFLLILLGGINGPFHSAIVSVLSKHKREDASKIVETITTLVVGLLLIVAIALVIFAEPMMKLTAPGLFLSAEQFQAAGQSADTYATLELTRAIAIEQFRIMAPLAVLAGLIGIGFGSLNASDQYWLPSISPIFSSVSVLVGLGGLAWYLGEGITQPENAMLGGAVLAWSVVAGAVLQWLAQLPAQWKSGLAGLRLRFNFNQPEVREVLRIMGPATFSSGMMQINVWTDLFFASFIPDAAAAVSAMGYAGLLVQTPLGILSNVILVPLLPVFSRLAAPDQWPELKTRIRQGLMMTALTMLPISAMMIALAVPISRVVYERYAFTVEDSFLTAAVLIAYAIGMFVYLGRDVLVRVFYGLGDGNTPFRISVFNIGLNAVLDAVLVGPFGAVGLVLATVGVNLTSMLAMLWVLNRRLRGLPIRQWSLLTLGLSIGSVITGAIAWGVLQLCERWLGTEGFGILLLQLCLAGAAGFIAFVFFALQLRLPEVDVFADRIRQKFFPRRS
ncbi:murein biosynthesis integral membrane protein MurJ [Leptolyngbya sp. AN02str]|uniref:murein biosynthesis integral membrane protein MurJ n=1 Tax=Leptolyngbya sp. AN02str TaxID=3423363 RepID=UPI003D31D7A1